MGNGPDSAMTRRLLGTLAGGAVLGWALPAWADWPDRTITIVVHFAPGGSNDLLGRLIGAELGPRLGQSVLVENRPGANGNIGVAFASRANPDGYTLAVISGSALVNPALMKVSYDMRKDFIAVAYLGSSPSVILTGPNSGMKTLADLLSRARAAPGRLTYGTPGIGSTPHLAMELLQVRAGVKLTHVPYTGAAPAVTAVMGGTTDLCCANISGIVSNILSGNVRALADTGTVRWPQLPDVPTLEEAGIHDAASDTSQYLLARTGTPAAVIDRLATEVKAIMAKPDVKSRMLDAGFAVDYAGPAEAGPRMAHELESWAQVVREAHVVIAG